MDSYEFDYNIGGNSWTAIEQFLKLISYREDIWYASNIQIVDQHIKLSGTRNCCCDCTVLIYSIPNTFDKFVMVSCVDFFG